jgi:hypothetical protein
MDSVFRRALPRLTILDACLLVATIEEAISSAEMLTSRLLEFDRDAFPSANIFGQPSKDPATSKNEN